MPAHVLAVTFTGAQQAEVGADPQHGAQGPHLLRDAGPRG